MNELGQELVLFAPKVSTCICYDYITYDQKLESGQLC